MSPRFHCVTALLALFLILVISESSALTVVDKFEGMFENFKRRHKKVYKSLEEEAHRLSVFIKNVERAKQLSANNPHATFSAKHSRFGDLTSEEFVSLYLGSKVPSPSPRVRLSRQKVSKNDSLPSAIDWRNYGAVTRVKDQKQCGSCWAFSTTGTIEGAWAAAGNTLTPLSEQELVSCDDVDGGCNGGMMGDAIKWLLSERQGKVLTEESYPYTSGSGVTDECQVEGGKIGAVITDLIEIEPTEEAIAAQLVKSGPVAVAVDASSWQLYISGVFSTCDSSELNHGVLVVGYNDTANPPYWIIKNSWSEAWGEEGYIRIEKGTQQCGLGNYAATVQVGNENDSGSGTPPPPPSPPPSPEKNHFVVKTCYNSRCSMLCTSETYPTGKCIEFAAGGSGIFKCHDDIVEKTFFNQPACSGPENSINETLGVCLEKYFYYYENICPRTNTTAK